jgi:tetratricopeptide (TPR) repeat protein
MALYFCPHCEKEFDLPQGQEARCPTCLRRNDLVPLGAPGIRAPRSVSNPRSGLALALAVLGVLLAVGVVAWLRSRVDAPPAQGPRQAAAVAPVEVPAPEVESLALKYQGEAGLQRFIDEVQARVKDGGLVVGPGKPFLKPSMAASSWANRAPAATDELSLAWLLTGLARAQGLDLAFLQLRGVRDGGSSVGGRRLAVRLKGQVVPLLADVTDVAAFEPLSAGQLASLADVDRGRTAREAGDFKAAAEALEAALARTPDQPQALFERCRLGMARKVAEFALPDCDRALSLARDVDGLVEAAGFYLDSALLYRAFQLANEAVALEPQSVPAWLRRAEVRLAQLSAAAQEQRAQLLQEVDQAIEKARGVDPAAPRVHLLQAKRAFLQDDYVKAADEVETELKLHPETEEAYTLLGDFYGRSQMWPELEDLYLRYLERWPNRPQGLQMAAVARMSQNRGAEAEPLLRKLLEVDPRRQGTRIQLATLLFSSERLGEAMRLLDEEREQFPDDPAAPLLKAQVLALSEKWGEAEPILTALLERFPRNADAYELLYTVYRRQSAPDKARALLERAESKLSGARHVIAERLLQGGMVQEGVEVLKETLDKDPADERAAVTLAAVYHALGRAREAQEVRAAALSRSPNRELLEQRFNEAFEEVTRQEVTP